LDLLVPIQGKKKKGPKMSQKLTLARYLRGGGEVKTLTRIEAIVFGVPYPLQPGWPSKYGAKEITAEMIDDVRARIAVAKESTAKSAHRRLDALDEKPPTAESAHIGLLAHAVVSHTSKASSVPGFVLRQARRYRARKSAPWV
jgi:hypothetical protein